MSEGDATVDGYLLDSHVLLWWWFLPERLSSGVLTLLQDPASRIWVSSATVWELSIKHHSGKLIGRRTRWGRVLCNQGHSALREIRAGRTPRL